VESEGEKAKLDPTFMPIFFFWGGDAFRLIHRPPCHLIRHLLDTVHDVAYSLEGSTPWTTDSSLTRSSLHPLPANFHFSITIESIE
jgi:hypothetical protein